MVALNPNGRVLKIFFFVGRPMIAVSHKFHDVEQSLLSGQIFFFSSQSARALLVKAFDADANRPP